MILEFSFGSVRGVEDEVTALAGERDGRVSDETREVDGFAGFVTGGEVELVARNG